MHYQLDFDKFTQIPYTTGTIQNINESATVEICVESTENTGLVLYPREKYEWDDKTIYARAKWSDGEAVTIAALPLLKSGGGGGGGGTVTVTVGTTTTGAPGTPANVTNSGTSTNVVLDFVIPRGADGTGTGGGIADWAANTQYTVGMLVLKDDQIYRCATAHTSSTWSTDIGNWALVSGTSVWAANTTYHAGELIFYNGRLYYVNTDFTSGTTFNAGYCNIIGAWEIVEWQPNTYYPVGTILHYQGQLYRVATGMTTSSTFNPLPLMEGYVVPTWQAGGVYSVGDLVQYNGNYYEVTQDFAATVAFSTACMQLQPILTWAPNTAYSVGDIIVNNNIYYEATANFTSGATFSTSNLIIYVYTPVVWTANTIFAAGQLIDNGGTMYIATQRFTSGSTFSTTCLTAYTPTPWAANTVYSVRDILEYGGDLYVVLTNFHSGSWFTTAILESYTPMELTAQQIADIIDSYSTEMGEGGDLYARQTEIVGTWIDGSTVYQKTFETSVPSSSTATSVASLVGLGIKRVVEITGFVYDAATTGCYPVNFGNVISTWASLNDNAIMMEASSHLNAPAFITIRYIK